MKASAILALSITTLVACGDSRPSTVSSCSALAACCASGLPGGAGLSCSQLSGSTDQGSCDAALSSLHDAGYCKDVSNGPSVASGDSCPRYLSCLLATEPEAYAAAIQLYGEGSACWKSSAQSSGCEQACEASFARIESLCTCSGTSCSECKLPSTGSYHAMKTSAATCGQDITIELASFEIDDARMGSLEIQYVDPAFGYNEITLEGPMQCGGSSTLTGTKTDSFGCKVDVSATLTQPVTGKFLTLSGTWKVSCPSYPTDTCSQTFALSN
jgi:hypothetical protein